MPLSDTDPEAAEFQRQGLASLSVAQRLRLTRSLTATVIELARAALRRADPAASETEIGLRFVGLHYGPELEADVRAYLARRG